MKSNYKKTLIAAAVLAFCIVLTTSSTSIQGSERTYEIRPEITLPEHKSDTRRFIESYERILQRLITSNEKIQFNSTENLGDIKEQLNEIDEKLDNIIVRLKKIETALNIDVKSTIQQDQNKTTKMKSDN